MKKTLLIDTSILLHYKRLDQIDWVKEVGASKVEILLVPVVIRELDKHKEQHPVKRVRKRAADYVKWINSLFSKALAVQICNGVTLRIVCSEPSLDFAVHQLDKGVADDWLIAHAIEESQGGPDSSVPIVTADVGLRLKGLGHNLDVVWWADNKYKLPENVDPDEKRVRELEQEIRQLKNRVPVLELRFPDGQRHHEFTLTEIPRETIDAILDDIWENNQCGHRDSLKNGFSSRAHDQAVRDYCSRFESYLKELSYFQGHVIELGFVLTNVGTAVGDDIDVQLLFPDNLDIKSRFKTPAEPAPPKVYLPSESFDLPKVVPIGGNLVYHMPPDASLRPGLDADGPTVNPTTGVIGYHVPKVKHNQSVELTATYVFLDDPSALPGFQVTYKLFAGNIRDVVESSLSVIITDAGRKQQANR